MLRSHWLVWGHKIYYIHFYFLLSFSSWVLTLIQCLHVLWGWGLPSFFSLGPSSFPYFLLKAILFSIENILAVNCKDNGDLFLNSQFWLSNKFYPTPVLYCLCYFNIVLIFKIGRYDLYSLFLCFLFVCVCLFFKDRV